MAVPFPGFTGPSYQLTNRYAAIERTVNWFCTPRESREESKFTYTLDPTPANAAFSQLPVPAPFNQPCRGLLELRGVCYGVNGTRAYKLSQAGVYQDLGAVVNSNNQPVSMVANGNGQIFIGNCDANGTSYVIDSDILTQITTTDFLGAVYAAFQDGYVLVVTPNSNQFQISGTDDTPVGDARLWSALNFSIQAGQADLLRAIGSSREYLRLFGARRSQIYANVGANGIGGFPFQSYNDTFIETGIGAAFSLNDLGDSWMWLGEDVRGQRACWRDAGFQPQRVSTFAVEAFWQKYVRVDDAIAFSFIWDGHLHYRITFPTAYVNPGNGSKTSATWDYDVTASAIAGEEIWDELQSQDPLGFLQGRSECFHAFCYGRHLVGSVGTDGNPGAVYQYSDTAFTDCAADKNGNQVQNQIIRDRIAPHLWLNNSRVVYDRLQLECARGVGLDGAPATGTNPQMILRLSRNYGNTFGPELNTSVGEIGQSSTWVYWLRLGLARDLVTWVRYSEPTYMGILNAELDLRECS